MQQYRPYICPFEEVLRFVPERAEVLDVGCGDGLLLGLLAQLGYGVCGIGFDSSEPAIACARSMAERLHLAGTGSTLDYRRIDATAPWPEGQFDVVSLIDVLHHVHPSAQRNVILTAASKVRPGGRLVYKDIAGTPVWRGLPNTVHDLVIARQIARYVPVSRVEAWAVEAGLTLEAALDTRRLWYPHELRVFRNG
jgi:2-polyprenyl-3-methyl-5-hydroxy-6-metoxy-1,4-benzoquinol methylase